MGILYTALFFMAVLLIPVALLLTVVSGIWTLTDKILRRLENR